MAKVSVLTKIVSPNAVTSPVTGLRAAIIHLEVLEDDASLGVLVLGDIATLRAEDGSEFVILARRARVHPASGKRDGTPLKTIPAEIVPLLANASGRGVLCYRELQLCTGSAVRLNAYVEPTAHLSGTRVSYVARDDVGPVVLEEVTPPP